MLLIPRQVDRLLGMRTDIVNGVNEGTAMSSPLPLPLTATIQTAIRIAYRTAKRVEAVTTVFAKLTQFSKQIALPFAGRY